MSACEVVGGQFVCHLFCVRGQSEHRKKARWQGALTKAEDGRLELTFSCSSSRVDNYWSRLFPRISPVS